METENKEKEIDIEKEEEAKEKVSQADRLVDLVLDYETLFRNQYDQTYIQVDVDEHREYWPLKSGKAKKWLGKRYWDEYNKVPNGDSIKNAMNVIEGHAFSAEKYELSNRVSYSDGAVWYDMVNDNWDVVLINSAGWRILKRSPILFQRYSHQKPQVMPEIGGDIWKIFDYINIKKEDHKILLLAWIVSCFIPGFPHPIIYLYGPQGSAKSTTSSLLRRLVDPSSIEVAIIPKDQKELIQNLSHHWVLIFDNVSSISPELSDLLCRAVSGSGFSKRELYSDDDDIIYSFKRCMGINGINLVALKPDLMERSILIELERIPKERRTQEEDLFNKFNSELPKLIGAIFDVVSKAITIKPNIKIDTYPRMADFALWGSAIAEAIGHSKEDFLNAYQRNIDNQNDEVINENAEASFILGLMQDKNVWEGSATQLLKGMKDFYIDDENINFPKKPQNLTRKLNELKTNLEEAGIKIQATSGRSRKIIITKFRKDDGNTASIASLPEETENHDPFEEFADYSIEDHDRLPL